MVAGAEWPSFAVGSLFAFQANDLQELALFLKVICKKKPELIAERNITL
jgi:hypothetical protein